MGSAGGKMDWLGKNPKAIAPLRVSSYNQRENTSHTTQENEIRRYCEEAGLELVKVFPLVESARRSELRKKYVEALNWGVNNRIRHIVFYKFDREARNLTDNERNENLVRDDKIVLHYVSDRKVYHKHSPDTDFFMRDINAVTNKHYSRELSTKVKAATHTKAESGWYPGTHTPLGYLHQKLKDDQGREFRRGSIIVPDPNEKVRRQILREFELRGVHKLSLGEIRKQIIAEKLIPLDRRASYAISSIDRRLKSRFYIGFFEWQGKEYLTVAKNR